MPVVPAVTYYVYGSSTLLTRVTDPMSHNTDLEYDGYGRRTKVKNHDGYETVTAFNKLDQVTSVTTPDPDGGEKAGAVQPLAPGRHRSFREGGGEKVAHFLATARRDGSVIPQPGPFRLANKSPNYWSRKVGPRTCRLSVTSRSGEQVGGGCVVLPRMVFPHSTRPAVE